MEGRVEDWLAIIWIKTGQSYFPIKTIFIKNRHTWIRKNATDWKISFLCFLLNMQLLTVSDDGKVDKMSILQKLIKGDVN